MEITEYSTQSFQKVLKKVDSTTSGLTTKDAQNRLAKFGVNEIIDDNRIKWPMILLSQFKNLMVLILIFAIFLSSIMGEFIDAIAIGIIVLINATIGFFQEYKAEKTIQAMRNLTAATAIVIRDGKMKKILGKELVPGDILVLEEGMNIAADARIIEFAQLYTMEASITGESIPIEKTNKICTNPTLLAEMKNIVFSGTKIVKGHGVAVVTNTGMRTEFGKIANLIQIEDQPTPLQKKLTELSKNLAYVVLVLAIILIGISILKKHDLFSILPTILSLAVSVIPEGLPAVITLTLGIGVQKLAKKNAIIRKLASAETLGSVNVICTDKTGTLTKNEMTVKSIYLNTCHLEITKNIFLNNKNVDVKSINGLAKLINMGILCNNSSLISGDPTESCLLTLAEKAGIKFENIRKKFPRISEIVFDSDRKRMSTINKMGGDLYLNTKGAPDSILDICDISAKEKREILNINDQYASQALRVLAFAQKKLKKNENPEEKNMTFMGLIGIIDPPREGVKESVQKCKEAGIDVVMITGDHKATAMAIGKEIGIYNDGDMVLTGKELERMTDKEILKVVEKIKIYARVNPSHKVKILKALKKKGKIVAMTGDGINDAPALSMADIGIAMGITGTDVSKEASDMVLADDNFSTIVASVESGRIIYSNIKRFVRFLLSANFDEMLIISTVFIMDLPLPLLPLQILWINLLTDSLPAIALGIDTGEKDIMKLGPRNSKTSIVKELLSFAALTGSISAIMGLIIFFNTYWMDGIEKARSMVFTSAVIFELLLVFSARYEYKHYFTNFFSNKFLSYSILGSLFLQLFVIYSEFGHEVFSTVSLNINDWLLLVEYSILGIVIIEVWKMLRKKPVNI